MSENLIHDTIKNKLGSIGIDVSIQSVPELIQTVTNLTAIQQFIVDIDDNHPAHEMTEEGDKFFTSLKNILIKNLDSYDKVEYHEIHYDFGSTLSFYNSKTDEIKSYSLNCKTFTISQYINEAYQDGKFKEYDRSLFVENLDLNDDD
jgi:hypothetical protein